MLEYKITREDDLFALWWNIVPLKIFGNVTRVHSDDRKFYTYNIGTRKDGTRIKALRIGKMRFSFAKTYSQ